MNSKIKLVGLFILGMHLCAPALAEECESTRDLLGVSGSVRLGQWERNKSFSDEFGYSVASGWLTLRPKEFLGFKAYVDGFVQGSDLSRKDYSEGDLREFYVEKSMGAWDFKLGRAITVWGRADKVNPTDSLSVRNYRMLVVDDEEQRTGVFTTQLVYNFDNTRLIALWLPEWRSPLFPISPVPGIVIEDLRPDRPQEQSGFKIDQTGNSFDWSVSYFHGYSKTPDLSLISANSLGVKLGLVYGLIDVYGFDFATSLAEMGVRGEVAYTKTKDSDGLNPLVQNSNVFAVFGVEKNLFENFNLNVQFLYKNIQDFQDPNLISDASTQLLAKQMNLNANQLQKEQSGISARASYKMWNETLELELAYVTWLKNSDSLVRPKVSYALTDHLKLNVGADVYRGDSDTFFGRLKDTSSAFGEIRYNF